MPENNICIVGDDDQCQPKGTKVLLNNGEYKNIEELKIGDELASFDISSDSVIIKKSILINKVEDISSRPVYNEALISVNTAKNKTLYTYNHRTYAEINYQSNLFALYLVYRET